MTTKFYDIHSRVPLIEHGRAMPVYKVNSGRGESVLCILRSDFEDLDAERRRLRQALVDRGVDPNDIPPVDKPSAPDPALFWTDVNETLEMPRYRSHKIIWALKIAQVNPTPTDRAEPYVLIFEGNSYPDVEISYSWKDRFKPKEGGYYVVYQDGYTSFSPAAAFEEGYTRIP